MIFGRYHKMQKILIVEDDEKLRNELEIFLSHQGYQAECLKKFDNTIHDILEINPNLILLDINFTLLKKLQEEIITQNVPVILITGLSDAANEQRGLILGAVDYITKPFNIHILLAKVNSLLRRTNSNSEPKNKIDAKDFILNISNSTIIKNDKTIDLTKNEYKILKYLIEEIIKIEQERVSN